MPPAALAGMPPERPLVPFAVEPMLPKLEPPEEPPPKRPRTPFGLTRSRVYDPSDCRVGNWSAPVICRCDRLSRSLTVASLTFRFAAATRLSSDVSSGSPNRPHQLGSTGSSTGWLTRRVVTAVPPNQVFGANMAGLDQFGPTVHAPTARHAVKAQPNPKCFGTRTAPRSSEGQPHPCPERRTDTAFA